MRDFIIQKNFIWKTSILKTRTIKSLKEEEIPSGTNKNCIWLYHRNGRAMAHAKQLDDDFTIDWLFDWLNDYLIDWFDWLNDYLIDWFDYLID